MMGAGAAGQSLSRRRVPLIVGIGAGGALVAVLLL
jgi:hypothetical protein